MNSDIILKQIYENFLSTNLNSVEWENEKRELMKKAYKHLNYIGLKVLTPDENFRKKHNKSGPVKPGNDYFKK